MKSFCLQLAELMRRTYRSIRYFFYSIPPSKSTFWCPVCEKSSRNFLNVLSEDGKEIRQSAKCPYCNSLERHRFVWLYFLNMTDLFDEKQINMLHIAPEPFFQKKLKDHLGKGYITADLYDPRSMVRMDISDINFPAEFFEVIYCSHVLEHVADDLAAISELHRVLSNEGWAILQVPITVDKTVEDPTIIDPIERLKLFGQEDHVRRYGKDFGDRLLDAGFTIKVATVEEIFTSKEAIRMGLTDASGEIFFVKKKRRNYRTSEFDLIINDTKRV